MEEEKKSEEKAEMCKLGDLFKFLHGKDRILLIVGSISGVAAGMAMPAFVFFFGGLTDSFNPDEKAKDTLGKYY